MAGFSNECCKWLLVGLVCASACGQPDGVAVNDGGGGGGDTGLLGPGGSGSTSTGGGGGTMSGTTSGTTGGSSTGGGSFAGCTLSDGDFPSGAANPNDACLVCDPASSVQAWSQAPDGTACATGSLCQGGACIPACIMGGAISSPGTPEVGNDCQSCQPQVSTTAWTALADDTPCSTNGGNFCGGGACVPGCSVGGQLYTSAQPAPANACQLCLPQDSDSSFSAVADGTFCAQDGGNYCVGGSCQLVCDIDNAVVANGTMQPNDPNACCNAALSPREWQRALQPMDGGLAVGAGVQGAFLVDMNGDGKLDLIVGSASEVEFFPGNGDGTFGAATSTPAAPAFLAIADVNGDGRPDIVEAVNFPGGTAEVTVLLNTGGAGQLGFSSISNAVPGPVVALATGDFQGTGRPQMAIVSGPVSGSSSRAASVTLLEMQASGTFFTVGTYSLPFANPAVAVAGKFGGGTQDELAIVDGIDTGLAILRYGGLLLGVYQVGQTTLLPVSSANLSIAQADLNQDGLPDLLVGEVETDTLFVLLNGGGSSGFDSIGFQALPSPAVLVVADFNGDGAPDVAANGGGGIEVLLNETPAAARAADFAPISLYPVAAKAIATGDLNGDGRLDAVGVDGTAVVLLGSCP